MWVIYLIVAAAVFLLLAVGAYAVGRSRPLAKRWAWWLPAHVALTFARYPLAVVAVLWFSTPNLRHLTRFQWLETSDNDLGGDSGWRAEHLIGSDPLSTFNRIRWLWRNGANALNYGLLGVGDDPAWRATVVSTDTIERADGAWEFRKFSPAPKWLSWSGYQYVERFYGWSLLGPENGRCKFVFSLRLRSTTN